MRAQLLVLALLLVAACGPLGDKNENAYFNPAQQEYFEGYDGVEFRFQNIPSSLFYYADVPGSTVNEFPITMMVENKGASLGYGALYLSGFDPHIIQFDRIPLAGFAYQDACSLNIGDYTVNSLGLMMDCGGFQWFGREGNWLEAVNLYGSKWFGSSVLSTFGVNYRDYRAYGGDQSVLVNFDLASIPFEDRQHGRLLIAAIGGLDFERWLGQPFILAGDTYEFPGGEVQFIDYNGLISSWPLGADSMEQHILATSCYAYTTFAAPMVCIDPSPYATNRKVCQPEAYRGSGGQGAPLAITSIVQENTPRQAIFHITVENKGGGTVYSPGALEKCSPYFPGGARPNDLNSLWIGLAHVNGQPLRCNPFPVVRLQNGKAQFTCSYLLEYAQLNSAYKTPLVLELWYGYSETQDRAVTIKRIT